MYPKKSSIFSFSVSLLDAHPPKQSTACLLRTQYMHTCYSSSRPTDADSVIYIIRTNLTRSSWFRPTLSRKTLSKRWWTMWLQKNTSGINAEIKVNGQKLEIVTSFKHLGSVITDEGSKLEMLSRIAQAIAALTRLKPVLNDRSISLSSMIR